MITKMIAATYRISPPNSRRCNLRLSSGRRASGERHAIKNGPKLLFPERQAWTIGLPEFMIFDGNRILAMDQAGHGFEYFYIF